MLTDPIADMLTRIRNAAAVSLPMVDVPYSTIKMAILHVMKGMHFIEYFEKKGKKVHKHIAVKLKYTPEGLSAITGIKRISTPGRRIYKKSSEIHQVKKGYGIVIVSTPKGLMTDDGARKEKVGGEVICEVW